MADFKINSRNRLREDVCYREGVIRENKEILQYNTPKYLGDRDPSRDRYFDSVQQAGVFQTGNFSGYPSHIDDGSAIRNGKLGNVITHGRASQIFDTEDYFYPPYMGSGKLDADMLSRNKFGESTNTREIRRGKEIDRFVPLLPNLKKEIQNPKHLVPEYWVNGGMDTRTIVRNIDYLKTCGLRR